MADEAMIRRICAYADAQNAPETPTDTEIDGFSFVRARSPSVFEAMIYQPLLCLVLQGCKESCLGDELVRFGEGETLIVSLDMPSASRVRDASAEKPYVSLALLIDLDLIRTLSDEMGHTRISDDRSSAIISGKADAAITDAMMRMFGLIGNPREQRVMVPLLKKEIHFRLLLAHHGGMLRRLAQADSRVSRITHVLSLIRKDYDKVLKVADLADAAGMSPSSFHDHFKRATATTPLQYQKDLRLLEARRQLAESGRPISDVAFTVGYESPTQFSREYSRKFGIAPREDRARRAAYDSASNAASASAP